MTLLVIVIGELREMLTGWCLREKIYKTPNSAFYTPVAHDPLRKRDSRVVSALATCARGPGFDPRRRRGKFVGPNLLPFVSFAGMT